MYKSDYFCECGRHDKHFYPEYETKDDQQKGDREDKGMFVWVDCGKNPPVGMEWVPANKKSKFWGRFAIVATPADGWDSW